MKKLLLLAVLLPLFSNAQNLTIPDAVFKSKLVATGYVALDDDGADYNNTADTNGDGEISAEEAAAVTGIKMNIQQNEPGNAYIESLQGIDNFTGLKRLNISFNHIQGLDATTLIHLQELNCSSNQLTSLDVTGLGSMTALNCEYNLLTDLNTAGLNGLKELRCSYNKITAIDTSPLYFLESLYCFGNNIETLDLSLTPKLERLGCSYNNITSINIINHAYLVELQAAHNELETLDVTGLTALVNLDLANNSLTTLNTMPLGAVSLLYLQNNPISLLEIENMPELFSLNISNTALTGYLDCSTTNIWELKCSNNPGITGINIKNGTATIAVPDLQYYPLVLQNLPALESICIDEDEFAALETTAYNPSGTVSVYTGENCETALSLPKTNLLQAITLYPNPSATVLNINGLAATGTTAEIYDLSGKLIAKHNLPDSTIDVSSLNSGAYYLKLTSENTVSYKKFIKN